MSDDSAQSSLEIVRAYFTAAEKGDLKALLQTLHEEGTITVPDSLPYGGVYRGRTGFESAMRGMALAISQASTSDFEYFLRGDDVFVLSRLQAQSVTAGKTIDMRIAELFRIKNGRILSVVPFYYDTALLQALLLDMRR